MLCLEIIGFEFVGVTCTEKTVPQVQNWSMNAGLANCPEDLAPKMSPYGKHQTMCYSIAVHRTDAEVTIKEVQIFWKYRDFKIRFNCKQLHYAHPISV